MPLNIPRHRERPPKNDPAPEATAARVRNPACVRSGFCQRLGAHEAGSRFVISPAVSALG